MKRTQRKTTAKPAPKPQATPLMTAADFWRGSPGNEYTLRNRVTWTDRVPFWQHIIEVTGAQSFLEVGCNAGWNLQAIRSLSKEAEMSGVDLNEGALQEAQDAGFDVEVANGYDVARIFGAAVCDIAFTSGVLIHVPPDDLLPTMRAIRDVSRQYVLAVEYASDDEREIEYRGHAAKLWARPFGRLYEELGLSLVETGEAQGFDRCQWWLLEKE